MMNPSASKNAHAPIVAPTTLRQQRPSILSQPAEELGRLDLGDSGGDDRAALLSLARFPTKSSPGSTTTTTVSRSTAAAAPAIRIQAPTPEGDAIDDHLPGEEQDADAEDAVRLARPRRPGTPASGSPAPIVQLPPLRPKPQASSRHWTDELIKQSVVVSSAFDASSSSSSSAASSHSSSISPPVRSQGDEEQMQLGEPEAVAARSRPGGNEGMEETDRGELSGSGEERKLGGEMRPRKQKDVRPWPQSSSPTATASTGSGQP